MHLKKYVSGVLAGAVAILLAGCGSSSSNSTSGPPLSGIKKRVLISNISPIGGDVIIVDAQKNAFSAKTIAASQPSKMVTAAGQTAILNSTINQVSLFDNTKEVITFSPTLQGQAFDIAISPEGKTAYAAIKNVGVVEVMSVSTGNVAASPTVPSVTRLVEGLNAHKLLAFADDPHALGSPNTDSFFVIDTGTNVVTAIAMPPGSQPFTAVFDPSDTNDTTAFVLNCGFECGGTVAPSVVKVNFATATSPVFTPSINGIPVSGATAGLLSGSSLFVAGTPTAPQAPPAGCTLAACGTLQVINTGALTAGAPNNITNGTHLVMAMTSNNHLYVGAAGCTVGPVSAQNTVQSCLSIFNTSAPGVSVPSESSLRQNFDVTGLQPISGANTIYVVQGGELDIFDINTSLPSTSIQPLDVVGKAINALQIDP